MTPTYYRNLPHLQPDGGQFFITFRIKDSIPQPMLEDYFRQRDARLKRWEGNEAEVYKEKKRAFARFDAFLDRCLTHHQELKRPEIAQIVMSTLHEHDGKAYTLLAYCVMPNHVHLVIDTDIQQSLIGTNRHRSLYQITGSMKSYSAKRINTLLGVSGGFWQRESYDHLIRSHQELLRIIRYTVLNPVNAELASEWTAWPYTYITPDLEPEFL